jgi:hypothetical protein
MCDLNMLHCGVWAITSPVSCVAIACILSICTLPQCSSGRLVPEPMPSLLALDPSVVLVSSLLKPLLSQRSGSLAIFFL